MENKHVEFKWWGLLAFLSTAFLYAFSFPLHQVSQFAYFFAVPFLFWACNCKNNKAIFSYGLLTGWIGWLFIVFYLRHIWFGLPFIASLYGGLYLGGWLFLSTIFLKKAITKSSFQRVIILLGAAGFWVVLEWIRGWLFSGYPWLPLAASQWKSPVLLQVLEWTGTHGLSFILIFFNLALALFLIGLNKRTRPFQNSQKPRHWIEGYIALIFLIFGIITFVKSLPQKENQEFAFKVGLLQPDIPATLKWDQTFFWDILRVLQEQSFDVQNLNPDLIVFPEAAIPSCLNFDDNMRLWIESLADEVKVPLLVGALAREDQNKWYNAIFVVNPHIGVSSDYYAKCQRVPFGEYVPLRKFLPFINKIVPLDFDLNPGESSDPLKIELNDREWKIGALICYEDIFSKLARNTVLKGANFLLVITNDAWYHQEAGAYQHAANSVLRAVEVRRPVIRCGNNGWSGWIDERGNIRNIMLDPSGSIYFKGVDVFPVYQDVSWANKLTFYVRYGDWFVILSALLVLYAAFIIWKKDGV